MPNGEATESEMPCSACGLISRVRHGAVGVTKAALGIDRVREGDLQRRLDACATCPWRRGAKCSKCTCYVKVKARISSETCPIGNWEKS